MKKERVKKGRKEGRGYTKHFSRCWTSGTERE